jgi:hypothetical protein
VAEHLDAERLAQERPGHRAERDAGRRLAGTGAFEDRACVVEVVLLHAGEVGVARTRPRQRGIACLRGEQVGVDGIGGHDRLPLGPFGVADPDGDGSAHGAAVPHAAGQFDLVGLEAHPRAATVTEAAPGEIVGDVGGRDLDTGGQPLEHADDGRAVRLTRGDPAQHGVKSVRTPHAPTRRAAPRRRARGRAGSRPSVTPDG